MRNINELRHELCVIFDEIRANKVTLPRAKELTNTAGKIINSIKLELVYAALRKETPIIEFLGGNLSPAERNNLLASVNGAPPIKKRRTSLSQSDTRKPNVALATA